MSLSLTAEATAWLCERVINCPKGEKGKRAGPVPTGWAVGVALPAWAVLRCQRRSTEAGLGPTKLLSPCRSSWTYKGSTGFQQDHLGSPPRAKNSPLGESTTRSRWAEQKMERFLLLPGDTTATS